MLKVGGNPSSFPPLLSLRLNTHTSLDIYYKFVSHTPSSLIFPDSMQSLCKNHFLQQLYRKIDGAVLWSQNERNLDCVITFQTHSILQRFMLRFDFLQLDCNDHLYIYDGAHAVGTYKVIITDFLYKLSNNTFMIYSHAH